MACTYREATEDTMVDTLSDISADWLQRRKRPWHETLPDPDYEFPASKSPSRTARTAPSRCSSLSSLQSTASLEHAPTHLPTKASFVLLIATDAIKPLVAPDRRSIIEELPPELYVTLLNYMPEYEAVSLSLACKQLWSQLALHPDKILYRMKRCIPLNDYRNFLNLLERDHPKLIACAYCSKLHSRLENEQEAFLWWDYGITARRECSEPMGSVNIGPRGFAYQVYREALHLMIRTCVLGFEHGMHTDSIKRSLDWKRYGSYPVHVKWDCSGLIAGVDSSKRDLSLLVRTIYQVEIDLRLPIRDQIESSEAKACGHETDKEREPMKQLLRSERDFLKAEAGIKVTKDTAPCTSYYQCMRCATDMEVGITRKPGEVFATLIVTAWRDLGGSTNFRALQWQQHVASWSQKNFPRQSDYLYGNERLKLVYERAQKQTTAPKSF